MFGVVDESKCTSVATIAVCCFCPFSTLSIVSSVGKEKEVRHTRSFLFKKNGPKNHSCISLIPWSELFGYNIGWIIG